MEKQFIPYEQALELKALGFDQDGLGWYNVGHLMPKITESKHITPLPNCCIAPLYQQAFAFFRNRFGYTFSIGRTNICVYHLMVQGTLLTNMIQDCKSYEEAELKCLIEFINAAKQNL